MAQLKLRPFKTAPGGVFPQPVESGQQGTQKREGLQPLKELPQGLKALSLKSQSARLKPCPDTKPIDRYR